MRPKNEVRTGAKGKREDKKRTLNRVRKPWAGSRNSIEIDFSNDIRSSTRELLEKLEGEELGPLQVKA